MLGRNRLEGARRDPLEARIARWEPELGALLDYERVASPARQAVEGPLSGVTVGVKDIVDVAGFPTRNGSLACTDAAPADADAPVVEALRAAGAHIVCKTATTEFAFTDPATTRNPFDPTRTPGGSSSGSGAAVGAGLLDLAIGTQTAGSLIRPAAYCGAVAFKPGLGRLSTRGMTPLAPSFDTIGFIARTVALARAAYLACDGRSEDGGALADARIGLAPVDPSAPVEAVMHGAVREALEALAGRGARIVPVPSAVDLARVVADHRTVMLHEAAREHAERLAPIVDLLQPRFRDALRQGAAICDADACAARDRLTGARNAFWESVSGCDVLIGPPTPGPAPRLDGTTGYQHMLTPWTVFAGPLVAVPWGIDGDGMPLSVMCAAPPGRERLALEIARALEVCAPPLPVPAPPPAVISRVRR